MGTCLLLCMEFGWLGRRDGLSATDSLPALFPAADAIGGEEVFSSHLVETMHQRGLDVRVTSRLSGVGDALPFLFSAPAIGFPFRKTSPQATFEPRAERFNKCRAFCSVSAGGYPFE
jgi:hypothetical protein